MGSTDLITLPSVERRLRLPSRAGAQFLHDEAHRLDAARGPALNEGLFLSPPPSFEAVIAAEVQQRKLFFSALTKILRAQGVRISAEELFIEQAILCSRVFCSTPIIMRDEFRTSTNSDAMGWNPDDGAWQFFPEPQYVDGMHMRFGFMRRDADLSHGKRRWIYSPVIALDPTVWQSCTEAAPDIFTDLCLQLAQQYRLSTHDWAHSLNYSFMDLNEHLPSSGRWFFSPATSPAYAQDGYRHFLNWNPEEAYEDRHGVAGAEIYSLALHYLLWHQLTKDHPSLEQGTIRQAGEFVNKLVKLRAAVEEHFDAAQASRASLLLAFAYFNSFHLLYPLDGRSPLLTRSGTPLVEGLRALGLPPFQLGVHQLAQFRDLLGLNGEQRSIHAPEGGHDWIRDPAQRIATPVDARWIPEAIEHYGNEFVDCHYVVPDYDGLRLRLALSEGGIASWIHHIESEPALLLLKRFAEYHERLRQGPPLAFSEGLAQYRLLVKQAGYPGPAGNLP